MDYNEMNVLCKRIVDAGQLAWCDRASQWPTNHPNTLLLAEHETDFIKDDEGYEYKARLNVGLIDGNLFVQFDYGMGIEIYAQKIVYEDGCAIIDEPPIQPSPTTSFYWVTP